MSNFLTPLFDAPKPYLSISKFTNRHDFLLPEQKEEFISELEKSFTEQAYFDKSISPKEFSDRFIQFDSKTLSDVVTQLGSKEKSFRVYHLLANIAKVAGIALHQIKVPGPIYQLFISDEKGSKNPPKYWGWIEERYVKGSKKLTECIKDEHIVIENTSLIKPSALFALHWFQWLQLIEIQEYQPLEVDISLEALLDLACFAYEWEVEPLLSDLRKLFDFIDFENQDEDIRLELSRAMQNYQEEIIKKALPSLLNKSEKESSIEKNSRNFSPSYSMWYEQNSSDFEEKKKKTSKKDGPIIIFSHHKNLNENSKWFDSKDPYGSIVRFSKRFYVLSKGEQFQFFSHVRRFFALSAYHSQIIEIPKKIENEFAKDALPFLLGTIGHKEAERQRLLASIQEVSQKTFLQLQQRDQLVGVRNKYGPASMSDPIQGGWVLADKRPNKGNELVAPLSLLKIEGGIPFRIFDLAEDVNLKNISNEELINTFIIALKQSLFSWHQKLLIEIKKRLKDKDSNTEISQLLSQQLCHKEVCAALTDLSVDDLCPDTKSLSEHELFHFFMFYMEKSGKGFNLSKFIGKYLQPTTHLFSVLDRFEKEASLEQKEVIKQYCQDRLFDLIPGTQRSFLYSNPQSKFAREIFEDFQRFSYSYATEEERRECIKFKADLLELQYEDFQMFYNFFNREDIIRLCAKTELEQTRKHFLTGLIAVHPKVSIGTVMERFVSECCSPLKEKNGSLVTVIEKLMDIVASDASKSKACEKLRKEYSNLSDEEIIQGWQLLREERTKKWFETNAPHISYSLLKSSFNEYFKGEILSRVLPIKKAISQVIEEKKEDYSKELALLYQLINQMPINSFDSYDQRIWEERFFELLSTEQIGSKEGEVIAALLEKNKVKKSFEENSYGEAYSWLLSRMKRVALANSLTEKFLKQLKEVLEKTNLNWNETKQLFCKSIFKRVYIRGAYINSSAVNKLEEKIATSRYRAIFDRQDYVQMALFLQQTEIKEFLKAEAAEFMAEEFYKTLNENSYTKIPVLIDVYHFIEAAKKTWGEQQISL